MRIEALTLFPEIFESPLRASILARAREAGLIQVNVRNIRDWAEDKHRICDDAPYGGGGGMVMKAEPVVKAIRDTRRRALEDFGAELPVIHMTPQGEPLAKPLVDDLARLPGMILLCGNYEGIDERAVELAVDREVSIGDYVLTGGELPALVLINAVARKIPGVVGNPDSPANDSFEEGLLDFPHYTRPEVFEGLKVPEVLLGGHHGKVAEWRRRESIRRTLARRPDLLASARLDKKDLAWIEALKREGKAEAE